MPEDTQSPRIGIVIATHGGLADALIEAVGIVLDTETGIRTATLRGGEDPARFSRTLQGLIRKANTGAGAIVLVDLFGGTPGTVALSLAEDGRVEVITGVNLAMALEAARIPAGMALGEARQRIVQAGQDAIRAASALLNAK